MKSTLGHYPTMELVRQNMAEKKDKQDYTTLVEKNVSSNQQDQ